MVTKRSIQVVTIMANGNRINFKIGPDEFKSSLIKDNKLRLFEWVESDKHDKYVQFYDITKVSFNKQNGLLETVELTPTTLRNKK